MLWHLPQYLYGWPAILLMGIEGATCLMCLIVLLGICIRAPTTLGLHNFAALTSGIAIFFFVLCTRQAAVNWCHWRDWLFAASIPT